MRRPPPPWWCVSCGDRALIDVILNVLLFTPVGVALAWGGRSVARAAAIAAVGSVAIELLQGVVPGRDQTLRDVLSNATGGWLGALLVETYRSARFPGRPWRWAGVGLAVLGVAIVARAFELRPLAAPLYAHVPPDVGHLEPLDGDVTSAKLEVGADVVALPQGLLPVGLGERLAEANIGLRLEGVWGASASWLAGLFMVTDEQGRDLLLVAEDRGDLVVLRRRRASDWRLTNPLQRIPGFFSGLKRGDRWTLHLSLQADHVCASRDMLRLCSTSMGFPDFWQLVFYGGRWTVRYRAWAEGLLAFCLMLPLAWLAAPTPKRERLVLLGSAVTLVTVALRGNGLGIPGWAAAFTAALAIVAGASLHAVLGRLWPAPNSVSAGQ